MKEKQNKKQKKLICMSVVTHIVSVLSKKYNVYNVIDSNQ